jgi:hypothetical protein
LGSGAIRQPSSAVRAHRHPAPSRRRRLVARASIPGDAEHVPWRATGAGFVYRSDPSATEPVVSLRLKAGAPLGGRIDVKARGAGLGLPDLSTLGSPITVVLRRSGSDTCWAATYSFPPATLRPTHFSAKSN